MKTHLMLDFETLGNKPNTVVLSLGAVLFTKENIFSEHRVVFNPRAQMQANRNVDFDTVLWWMGQSKEAKAIFEECSHSGIEMKIALDNFISWLKKDADENILVWSNGAGFDVPIMENLLSSFRIPIPWKFYNIRCYRTLKMSKGIEKGIQRNGVKHSEIDDARYQAKCIMNLIQQEPCFEC